MFWVIRILFFLLLSNSLVAFDIFPSPTIFSKEIWLYFSTTVILLVSTFFLLRDKNRFTFHFLDYFALGYLIIIPITDIFLYSNYKSSAITQQVCIGLCYISLRVISSHNYITTINLFIQSLLVVFALNIAIGLHQYLGLSLSYYPELGPTGFFFNPGPFAIFLSALVPWALVYIVKNIVYKKYGWSIFAFFLLGLGVFLIILSMSRSAWIGLFCGIILPLLFFSGNRNLLVASKKLVLFALGSLFFYFFLYHLKVESSNGRILVWKVSHSIIKDHWVTGIGTGKFSQQYIHYQKKYFDQKTENIEKYKRLAGDVRYAFNDYIQIFIEGGVLALIMFITTVICVMLLLILYFKRRNILFRKISLVVASGIVGSITVILTAGLTAYPLQVLPVSLFLWIQVSLGVSLLVNKDNLSVKRNKSHIYLGVMFSLLSIGVLGYGIQKTKGYILLRKVSEVNSNSVMRYRSILHDQSEFFFKVATIFEGKKDYEMSLKYMHKAVLLNPCPAYYYKLGSIYEDLNDLERAFKSYDFIDKAIPNLVTPKYLKSLIFYNTNDTLNFIRYAQEALNHTPKIYNYEVVEMRKDLRDKLKSF